MKTTRAETDLQRAMLKGVANKIEVQSKPSKATSLISVLSLVWVLLLIVCAPVLLQTVWEVIRGL